MTLDAPPAVDEDRATLAGNAIKKARASAEQSGAVALADDTGLFVDALNGRPGVRTARFAGDAATADDNKRHLLSVMDGVTERAARFRTVAALVWPDGPARTFAGVCEGRIAASPRGEGGFGYDALFIPTGHTRTFAEMPEHEKNAISHRKRALDAVRTFLSTHASSE